MNTEVVVGMIPLPIEASSFLALLLSSSPLLASFMIYARECWSPTRCAERHLTWINIPDCLELPVYPQRCVGRRSPDASRVSDLLYAERRGAARWRCTRTHATSSSSGVDNSVSNTCIHAVGPWPWPRLRPRPLCLSATAFVEDLGTKLHCACSEKQQVA